MLAAATTLKRSRLTPPVPANTTASTIANASYAVMPDFALSTETDHTSFISRRRPTALAARERV